MAVNDLTQPQYSQQEIEQMRRILLEVDRSTAHQTIDLSKPPVVPYSFKEFPMVLYKHSMSKPAHEITQKNQFGVEQTVHVPWSCPQKIVQNKEEMEAALKAGWSKEVPKNRYTMQGEEVPDSGQFQEAAGHTPELPDFTNLNKERLIAYGKAMFNLDLAVTMKRDEIISAIENAAYGPEAQPETVGPEAA